MPEYIQPSVRSGCTSQDTKYAQIAGKRTQLPRLNTNLASSEESLHLPIQHPSPTESMVPNIKRKAVKGRSLREEYLSHAGGLRRRSSDALGQFDPYSDPSTHLKDSRATLLSHKLVKGTFSSNRGVSNQSQEKLNAIKMRMEPNRNIRSPISPRGQVQGGIYQEPAIMSFMHQSVHDPQGRVKQVRAEQNLKRGNHVPKRAKQPRTRLRESLEAKARPEFIVANGIRRERCQLQRTKQWLNGRTEDGGYSEPLLTSRVLEEDLADRFDREYEARATGERRKMPVQKLKKPLHLVEGRSGFVEKATKYERQGVVEQDYSGWYGKNRKRDRAFKKVKVVIAKMLRPRKNQWQHI